MERVETGKKSDPVGYSLRDDDEEMAATILVARYRAGEFRKAFAEKQPGDSLFMLKVPFNDTTHTEDSAYTEHVWIRIFDGQGAIYRGTVHNDAQAVRKGDTVAVNLTGISDWTYRHNGRPVGEFTTRMIRRRMEPNERKEFDRETDSMYME